MSPPFNLVNLGLRPMLSALSRHKTAALLIALEIALCSAILGNAVFLVARRLSLMNLQSGLAENELVAIGMLGTVEGDSHAATEELLAGLRALPGVKSAVVMNSLPFSGHNWITTVSTRPGDTSPNLPEAAEYMGGPGVLETLGLHLIAGRDFAADEYMDMGESPFPEPPAAIMTPQMALKLFPNGDALGKAIYIDKKPIRIVGLVDHLAVPQPRASGHSDESMLLPVQGSDGPALIYVLRTDPDHRDAVLKAAPAVFRRLQPHLVLLQSGSFSEMRGKFFARDRDMAGLLTGVCVLLLLVTALGIVGLASFWVQNRTRQIGIRRALGATRGDILRYFQFENLLIAGGGVTLGIFATWGLNLGLLELFEVPRLPLAYLPVGCLALLALGQLAVLGPAVRASRVPPVVATRSV